MNPQDLRTFTRAYMEALEFTEMGPDSDFPAAEFSVDAAADIAADCRSFLRRSLPYVKAIAERAGWSHDDAIEKAGHDFWFTRNGHGVGFWDGDWPEPYGDKMTTWAQGCGTMEVYEGDDGLLYVA